MEEFPPESPPPLAVCRRKIDTCHAVILLIAHRYGSRPLGETLGYTELEYEYAVQRGSSCISSESRMIFPGHLRILTVAMMP
jgi:hypothetical protein